MATVDAGTRVLRTVLSGRHYLEGPRWHDGRVYVSDLYAPEVLAVDPDGNAEVVVEVPAQPSGTGWLPDGRLLVVSMADRTVRRLETSGELAVHADLSDRTPYKLNDMVVDDRGHAYLGGFGFDVMAYAPVEGSPIYHVAPDGAVTAYGQDLRCPNGHAILPDGRTLVVSETFGARLTAFDIAADGSLSGQRTWADFGDPGIDDMFAYVESGAATPDGLCVDAEGAVWMADGVNRRVLRVAEGGEILDEVVHDELMLLAPTLGGEDGRTLFICAAPTFDEATCRATRNARLLATEVAVPRAGKP